MQKQRRLGLELLRGLCAPAVASYHCLLRTSTAQLHSWGRYGVYVFFVISGAVLWINYHQSLGTKLTVSSFMVKRFARLAPLYALAVVCTAVLAQEAPSFRHLLNFSMLFGFANPGETSTVTGGWSLGIEVVLYVLFPLLVPFTRRVKHALIVLATLLALRVAFVETVLDAKTLQDAWNDYTQPAAFLFFFFAGMVIASVLDRIAVAKAIGALSLLTLLIAVGATAESILTGISGVAYSLLAVLLVAGFCWSTNNALLKEVCRFFGDISYGLYLLHPIVWVGISLTASSLPIPVRIAMTLVGAAAGPWVVLRVYERPASERILALASAKTIEPNASGLNPAPTREATRTRRDTT